MHDLLLKNILHLAGYKGRHPGQRPHTGLISGECSDLVQTFTSNGCSRMLRSPSEDFPGGTLDKNLPEKPSTTKTEGPKVLHFVRFREKSLWKSPDLTPPPANQSEPLASPGKLQSSPGNGNQSAPVASRETRTNQNSTRNPSPEGDQSDPETPIFQIFHARIPYISNVTQSLGLLSIAAASVSPAPAW